MKVVVTGANGCIGQAVVKTLTEKGHEVAAIDFTFPQKSLLGGDVKFMLGSILDKTFLRDAFFQCEGVVHLAAHLGVMRTETNRLRCIDINIEGTKNVLSAAAESKTCSKFVFASSSEVYGEPLENPVTEEAITQGKTIYSITKLAGEELVKAYQHELKAFDTSILRFFNTYGPGQVRQFVITKFISAVLQNKPPFINGAGDQIRSYCYATDTAQAVVSTLENQKSSGKIYNVGNSKEPISIYELAEKIITLVGKEHLIKPQLTGREFIDRNPDREINYRYCDTSKIFNDLGFEPIVSLDEGLKNVLSMGIPKDKWQVFEKPY